MMQDLPVLVVSCDRYGDLWRPFFELFFRHWSDCRAPVYLGTNFAQYPDARVRTIAVGGDLTWAAGVLKMLDAIGSEYVLLMLEDFLLMERVDDERIARLAAIARTERAGCLRLYSIYPPEHELAAYGELGEFRPGDRWRITAQAAIWRVDLLRRLLVPGFSPWDFEMIGSQICEFLPDRIWGVKTPALVYDQAVEKGKWRPQGLAICRAAGVDVDLDRRGTFSEDELRRHESAGHDAARFAEQKTAALSYFRQGRRREGWRVLADCLRARPWSAQIWAIGAAGSFGATPTAMLQRWHVRLKIAAASRAYARTLRAHAQPHTQ